MSPRQPTSRRTPASAPAADDRRARLRLRDLCDEVLASFRVATGQDPLSSADRAEAQAVLGRLQAPR